MADFELNGVTYRLAKLDAMTAFHVSRRVAPIMGAMGGDGDTMSKMFEAVGRLPDADAEYVISRCLTGCMRQGGDSWAKVYANGNLMFDDIGMIGMVRLTFETLKDNLSGFFTGLGSNLGRPAV